jgi:glycosyltransferase involved in cell wall biosynthesis
MPLRDDWASAAELIHLLDTAISSLGWAVDVLIVDDNSLHPCTAADFNSDFAVVQAIRVLRLRRNLGHQRARAVGLGYIAQHSRCEAVLVMDADGEDTAEGALQLLREFSNSGRTTAIFAERSRRAESLTFRLFYQLYKGLHRILTGVRVRVGNFSILPSTYLNTLGASSELWNHYAATVFRSGLPFAMIPIPRGRRIAGKSSMNFVALVGHGLSAISVFGDVMGVRLLIASLAGAILGVFGIIVVAMVRVFTTYAIPGWASYTMGILAILSIQLVTLASSFTFFILSNRSTFSFIPSRDYSLFMVPLRKV